MTSNVKSGITVSILILSSFLILDFWWKYAFGASGDLAHKITRFGFMAVFFLIYNFGWGMLKVALGTIDIIRQFFSSKEKEQSEKAGAWIVMFLGLALGFVWGVLCGIFSSDVTLIGGAMKMSQIGLIYGIVVFALIRFDLIILSEGAAEVALDAATGGELYDNEMEYHVNEYDKHEHERERLREEKRKRKAAEQNT